MASVYREGKRWTVAWVDHERKRKYARGIPSRELANQIASAKEFGKHAALHGIVDKTHLKMAQEAERAVSKHLDDFVRELRGRKTTEKYVAETRKMIERVFKLAGVHRINQMERFKLTTAIDSLPPERGEATLSIARRNRALAACKAFGYFLVKHDRLAANPLAREPAKNEELDRRRVRKVLTAEEALTLLETAETAKMRGGMTGEERMMRYALAMGTGLRQGTLFGLKPEDFNFDSSPAFVRVKATNTKGKKEFDQPLRADLAELVKPFVASRQRGRPVFPVSKGAKPIIAYRADLTAAGITYAEKGSELVCDQHAMRNLFITAVIRTKGLKAAQDLARHSTPNLTSKYGRLEMTDYVAALEGLPAVKRPKATRKKSG